MSEYVWDDLLNDTDRIVIKKGGYGQARGFGKYPVLLVLDMELELLGENKPIIEQIDKFPLGAGERAYQALSNINRIINIARKNNVLIIFTKHKGSELYKGLQSERTDIVIEKENDSAFNVTPLQEILIEHGIDTLFITGAGTSTAARATLVDAVTRMYNAAFVEDALFDRIMASHKTACLDVWMKFADVIKTQEVEDYLIKLKNFN